MCECNLSQCPRPIPKGKAHSHAELMMQYAQDAMTNPDPENLWEYRTSTGQDWKPVVGYPSWMPAYQYRRKPQTININGYEVPEPVSMPLNNGDKYWCPDYQSKNLVNRWTWNTTRADCMLLQRGFVHTTREAAELHAKALLSFTAKE